MALSVHALAAARRRFSRAPRSGSVQVVRVDPRVYALALDMAGNDPSRLQVLSSTSVLVLNQPRGGQR
jgi:hypothetical protein